MSVDSFADRYLVTSFESGGVVVDLATGNYFRVDPIAAAVCDELSNHEPVVAVGRVATRLGVSSESAAAAIAEALSALAAAPARGMPTGAYHFYPEERGYGLWHAGKRVLAVDGGSLDIFVPEDSDRSSPLMELYVRALAPKLMFLRGLTVFHASACTIGTTLVAFSGQSGAGKTTTVRAFVRAGAAPVVEDLLVLRSDSARPGVVLDGEARVHAWAEGKSNALLAGERRVSSRELATMADGAHATLVAVHFVDVQRRAGLDFRTRPLHGPDALLALMANEFLGASSRHEWRRFFETARSIASTTELLEVTAPVGLENLDAAARSYISNWTSYRPTGSPGLPSQA